MHFDDWWNHRAVQRQCVWFRKITTIDGESVLHRVIRYESLGENLESLCDEIGVGWQPQRLQNRLSGFRPRGCDGPLDWRETITSPKTRLQVAVIRHATLEAYYPDLLDEL